MDPTVGANKKPRTLHLDGKIESIQIADAQKRELFQGWLSVASNDLGVAPVIANQLVGSVFEVRQGYKSRDSKRQNADIANAATAYTQAFLPCVVLMSAQMDGELITRYRGEQWAILTGMSVDAGPYRSTYAFMRDIIGYDLAGFFERNAEILKNEITTVLEMLLSTEK